MLSLLGVPPAVMITAGAVNTLPELVSKDAIRIFEGETVPGLIVTQHSGDGKANQYFVRGFNLDHGTDFQTRLEGMPLNSPTHAHGQGYTDLNFLIPELVDYIDYRLGVYHTEIGDFGSAGGAELHLKSKLEGPFATVEAGENALARLALGTSSASATEICCWEASSNRTMDRGRSPRKRPRSAASHATRGSEARLASRC